MLSNLFSWIGWTKEEWIRKIIFAVAFVIFSLFIWTVFNGAMWLLAIACGVF